MFSFCMFFIWFWFSSSLSYSMVSQLCEKLNCKLYDNLTQYKLYNKEIIQICWWNFFFSNFNLKGTLDNVNYMFITICSFHYDLCFFYKRRLYMFFNYELCVLFPQNSRWKKFIFFLYKWYFLFGFNTLVNNSGFKLIPDYVSTK